MSKEYSNFYDLKVLWSRTARTKDQGQTKKPPVGGSFVLTSHGQLRPSVFLVFSWDFRPASEDLINPISLIEVT
jgi:hypothetical protein